MRNIQWNSIGYKPDLASILYRMGLKRTSEGEQPPPSKRVRQMRLGNFSLFRCRPCSSILATLLKANVEGVDHISLIFCINGISYSREDIDTCINLTPTDFEQGKDQHRRIAHAGMRGKEPKDFSSRKGRVKDGRVI